MNIHLVTHQYSDPNFWCIIEGWRLSGRIETMQVRAASNRTYLPQATDFWETLPGTDAVVLTIVNGPGPSNLKRACEQIDKHKLWAKTILLDQDDRGSEWTAEKLVPKVRLALIGRMPLVRGLRKKYRNVDWWPTCGIEQRVARYAPSLPWADWKDIPAVCTGRIEAPKQRHREPWMKLVASLVPDAVTGTVEEPNCAPSVHRNLQGARHITGYYETVSRARVGVHLLGAYTLPGFNFWEYATLKCALLSMHPALHPKKDIECAEFEKYIPPLIEGVDFEYFRSEADLKAKLLGLLSDPVRCERMAANALRKLAPFGSIARSERFYEILSGRCPV